MLESFAAGKRTAVAPVSCERDRVVRPIYTFGGDGRAFISAPPLGRWGDVTQSNRRFVHGSGPTRVCTHGEPGASGRHREDTGGNRNHVTAVAAGRRGHERAGRADTEPPSSGTGSGFVNTTVWIPVPGRSGIRDRDPGYTLEGPTRSHVRRSRVGASRHRPRRQRGTRRDPSPRPRRPARRWVTDSPPGPTSASIDTHGPREPDGYRTAGSTGDTDRCRRRVGNHAPGLAVSPPVSSDSPTSTDVTVPTPLLRPSRKTNRWPSSTRYGRNLNSTVAAPESPGSS